jgi:hypothetical protein
LVSWSWLRMLFLSLELATPCIFFLIDSMVCIFLVCTPVSWGTLVSSWCYFFIDFH